MTGGKTGTKAVSKEIAYSLKLFIDEKVWAKMKSPMFSIAKVSAGSVQTIFPANGPSQPVNLFDLGDIDLRLVIEDNTTSDLKTERSELYRRRNPAGVRIAIPLRLEVSKSVGASNKPTEAVRDDEVEAVFEILDPPEDLNIIKGPKHKSNATPKTGQGFIKQFAKELKKDQPAVPDDNCISQFAPRILRSKCRKLNERIKASKILYTSGRRRHRPFNDDRPPNENRARIKVRASTEREHLEGSANFFFCPPLILGDNYRLKITLLDAEGKATVLKDNKYQFKLSCFQTPVMTIWRKVRIHMVAYQYSTNLNKIVWDEIENAFNDAFMTIERPLPQRVYPLSMKEWMSYLGKVVYNPFRKLQWDRYKAKRNHNIHVKDFGDFSFPQQRLLTPEDKPPRHGPAAWTTWVLLANLAVQIFSDKLRAEKTNPKDELGAINWRDFVNPSKGKKFGLCVLLSKKPSLRSDVGGAYTAMPGRYGTKVFYIVEAVDPTRIFAHEFGHAVFLNHGATCSMPATISSSETPIPVDAPMVLRTEEKISRGPYFDEHRSEDMLSCIMSYQNNYYDKFGNKLADEDPYHKNDHPVDWHFCGVCLLKLRFYDIPAMLHSGSTIFRRIQYTKSKTGYPKYHDDPTRPPLKIATLVRGGVEDKSEGGFPGKLLEIAFLDAYTMKRGDFFYVFPLYPQEGKPNANNLNFNCYKDLSFLASSKGPIINGRLKRVEWVSTHPRKAYVRAVYIRNFQLCLSVLKALRPGSTKITFKVNISKNEYIESDPLNITVYR